MMQPVRAWCQGIIGHSGAAAEQLPSQCDHKHAYSYVRRIGEGSHGTVYECIAADGVPVAVKQVKLADREDERMPWLQSREVAVLRALPRHPCVVELHDAFLSGATRNPCLVFDLMERSLEQELEAHPLGRLGPDAVRTVAWQLALALAHCHTNKVIHRDVKPSNVLLSGQDPALAVKLCDFGLARFVRGGPTSGDDAEGGGTATAACTAGGGADEQEERMSEYVVTRWYRAPEIIVGDTYGTTSDVWSLGCTLAEAATGSPLFPGSGSLSQLVRIMRCFGPLPPRLSSALACNARLAPLLVSPPRRSRTLRQRLQAVEPDLQDLIAACLQLDPERRPSASCLLQMPCFHPVPRLLSGTPLDGLLQLERGPGHDQPQDPLLQPAAGALLETASVTETPPARGNKAGSGAGSGSAGPLVHLWPGDRTMAPSVEYGFAGACGGFQQAFDLMAARGRNGVTGCSRSTGGAADSAGGAALAVKMDVYSMSEIPYATACASPAAAAAAGDVTLGDDGGLRPKSCDATAACYGADGQRDEDTAAAGTFGCGACASSIGSASDADGCVKSVTYAVAMNDESSGACSQPAAQARHKERGRIDARSFYPSSPCSSPRAASEPETRPYEAACLTPTRAEDGPGPLPCAPAPSAGGSAASRLTVEEPNAEVTPVETRRRPRKQSPGGRTNKAAGWPAYITDMPFVKYVPAADGGFGCYELIPGTYFSSVNWPPPGMEQGTPCGDAWSEEFTAAFPADGQEGWSAHFSEGGGMAEASIPGGELRAAASPSNRTPEQDGIEHRGGGGRERDDSVACGSANGGSGGGGGQLRGVLRAFARALTCSGALAKGGGRR